MRLLTLLIIIIFFSSCAISPKTYEQYLDKEGLDAQLPNNFQHCHGYGCKFKTIIQFTQKDWEPIESIFTPLPQTATQERDAIKQAIAIFENRVGQIAGTEFDIAGTFKKTGKYQLDCVDESTNTTIYLSLLQKKQLLQLHQIEAPHVRIPIIHSGRWPHQSAVINEKGTDHYFVVDSWFHNNGIAPEIISLKEWKQGWEP